MIVWDIKCLGKYSQLVWNQLPRGGMKNPARRQDFVYSGFVLRIDKMLLPVVGGGDSRGRTCGLSEHWLDSREIKGWCMYREVQQGLQEKVRTNRQEKESNAIL